MSEVLRIKDIYLRRFSTYIEYIKNYQNFCIVGVILTYFKACWIWCNTKYSKFLPRPQKGWKFFCKKWEKNQSCFKVLEMARKLVKNEFGIVCPWAPPPPQKKRGWQICQLIMLLKSSILDSQSFVLHKNGIEFHQEFNGSIYL